MSEGKDFTYWAEKMPFTISELARRANVDIRTARKADNGEAISRTKALALLRVINDQLRLNLTPEDIDGLV